MELAELEKELMEKNKWLFLKLKEQKDLIEKAGGSERNYRVALAKKMLELRTEGMQITILSDIARGDKIIAELKLNRDIDKGVALACKNGIDAIQSSMSSLQTLISRHRAEMKLI